MCRFIGKGKKEVLNNHLDLKILDDNKTFWQIIKPLFSDKQKSLQSDITLVENEVAENLNKFFIESVENLDIETYLAGNIDETLPETLEEIMDKYDKHPSIKIKGNVIEVNSFSFRDISQDLENQILKLDTNKAIMEDDIPTKILFEANDIVTYHNQNYPTSLKLANVTPIHKKDEKTIVQ